jgi:putative hydrolase of the HAD superfamily
MEGALAATVSALEERRPHLAGRLSVELLHAHREAVAAEHAGSSLAELRLASFRRALRELGEADEGLADWMADRLLEARAECVAVHADVAPAMAELERAGYVLGAITNGNFPVDRLDVAVGFAFVVHAETVGELKPAAAPFAAALELAGGTPERWVHVGDDPEIDVAGAQAIGMRAVWLNRIGAPCPGGIAADAEIRTLEGLAGVVARLLDGDRPAR